MIYSIRKFRAMKTISKILFLVILIVASQQNLYSQKKSKRASSSSNVSVAVADNYFNNLEYYLAAKEYEKILQQQPDNQYAIYQLAESNRLHFNYLQAENNYSQLLDLGGKSEYSLAQFWYGVLLKLNGKYEQAQDNLQAFIDNASIKDPKTMKYKEIAQKELDGCKLALLEMKKPQKDYTFENISSPVNSSYSDYAPVIYKNDSSIVIASSRKESKGDEEFGHLGGEFSDNFRFEKNQINWSQMHDKDLFSGLQTELNESPGSFTQDKKRFYFTKCDEVVEVDGIAVHECAIYVSEHTNQGSWGKPIKLNENINMKGQWNAQPNVSPQGDTLFFVSKRPGGLGMHDIWMSTSSAKDEWGPAVNLGPQINTPQIDMSPCYYSKEKTLFFASNGREGFGGLDIFIATENGFSKIRNAGLPFNSNRDDFYFVLGEKKGYLSSNRDGGLGNDDIYRFNIKSKESVIAVVEKDSLGDAKSVAISGKLKLKDNNPGSDININLKDGTNTLAKTTRTDESGEFRFENLKVDDYKVTVDEDPRLTKEGKYIVDKVQVKKSVQVSSKKLFENIYFDFDKSTLRPEAIKVLDELVAYYKANPAIQIEMNGNTDAYGSDEYNIRLSKERGKTSLDYLTSKGVKKSALVVNAKGEGIPIATNNNPAGRQLNRRVEFYIIGGSGYEAKAMAYIIEPKTTLYSVAKKFNMTVEELKQINGISGEKIEAYRPLRVRRTGDQDIIAPTTLSHVDSSPTSEVNHTQLVATIEKKHEPKVKAIKNNKNSGLLKANEEVYVVPYKTDLFHIALSHGMSLEEIRTRNELKSDDLYAGQKLIVKNMVRKHPDAFYRVNYGETLFSISKKVGLSVDELKALNNLQSNLVYGGMVLKIKKL